MEDYQHLRFFSESNLQHIKDVCLVLCSLPKSLNTLFNHTHTDRPLAASVISDVSLPCSEMNACHRDLATLSEDVFNFIFKVHKQQCLNVLQFAR